MELSVISEEEAAGSSEQRAGSSRIGRLPNLRYMSSGAQHRQQLRRFTALTTAAATSEVPQRTAAWHEQRSMSVTANNAAAFLGLENRSKLG